jgi:hypothetical protein
MKRLVCSSLALLLGAAMWSGCWKQEVFLQDLNVTQGVAAPPVHLTTDSMATTVRISPRITFHNGSAASGRIDGHSRVNRDGIFQVDTIQAGVLRETPGANQYQFTGKNLAWNFPRAVMGFDIDAALTDRFALNGSIEFGLNSGGRVVNGHLGAALLLPGRPTSGRIEAGVRFQRHPYRADYLVTFTPAFSSRTEVWYRTISGSQSSVDPYVSLTLNSTMRERAFGWLLSLGYCGQTLLSFDAPRLDDYSPGSFSATLSVFSVTPAIVIHAADDLDVIGGVRILWPGVFQDENDPAVLIAPMIQFELTM